MALELDTARQPKKQSGQKEREIKRPERVPLGRYRDKLTVHGKKPEFVYRWIRDSNESGTRIAEVLRAGYDLVSADDVTVGQEAVHQSSNAGSIVRYPEKDGGYLFLVQIKKEYYDEDHAANQAWIDEQEAEMNRANAELGQYGKVSIKRDY